MRNYKDWIDQFERIAEINHWNDGQKLMWLKVRLTERALTAYKKLPTTAHGSFKNAVKALQERFDPDTRRDPLPGRISDLMQGKTES